MTPEQTYYNNPNIDKSGASGASQPTIQQPGRSLPPIPECNIVSHPKFPFVPPGMTYNATSGQHDGHSAYWDNQYHVSEDGESRRYEQGAHLPRADGNFHHHWQMRSEQERDSFQGPRRQTNHFYQDIDYETTSFNTFDELHTMTKFLCNQITVTTKQWSKL